MQRRHTRGGKTGRPGLAVLAVMAVLCLQGPVFVQAVESFDWTETWTSNGLCGWLGSTATVPYSNPGGFLQVNFKVQGYPALTSTTLRKSLSHVFPERVSARMLVTEAPSAMWLCLHSSRSGSMWYLPVKAPLTNLWFDLDAPVLFEAGWTTGPLRNRQQFVNDMLAVDWVGLYIRRGASCDAHVINVDDFRVRGLVIPDSVTLSGIIYYDGPQTGEVRVAAERVGGGIASTANTATPGVYAVTGVSPATEYVVSAFRDSNMNAIRDVWEPYGLVMPSPVRVEMDPVASLDMVLTDPETGDGVPLWWINRHFGLPIGGGAGLPVLPDLTQDPDADGRTSLQEFLTGTDPTDAGSVFIVEASLPVDPETQGLVLRWTSVANRRYVVWRTGSLAEPFIRIATDLLATPPENTYVDAEALGSGPYFYRVEVTEP